MIATDDYLSELRKQLSARYWPTRRVRDAVDEARQHLHETGEAPVEAFGEPADYADSLDAAWRQRDRPLAVRVAAAIGVALLAAIGGTLLGAVLSAESGLDGTIDVPVVQPLALAALFLLPGILTRARRRSVGTPFFLVAAVVIGGLGGIGAALLRSRGVGFQLSISTAIVLTCVSLLAAIAIGTLFFGAPWRQRRRARLVARRSR